MHQFCPMMSKEEVMDLDHVENANFFIITVQVLLFIIITTAWMEEVFTELM